MLCKCSKQSIIYIHNLFKKNEQQTPFIFNCLATTEMLLSDFLSQNSPCSAKFCTNEIFKNNDLLNRRFTILNHSMNVPTNRKFANVLRGCHVVLRASDCMLACYSDIGHSGKEFWDRPLLQHEQQIEIRTIKNPFIRVLTSVRDWL
jgi:hypothetical protein